MYFNPKTHKTGNPVRPIVSGINWATEHSSILLDEGLKPILYNHHVHMPKDVFHFIQKLESQQYQLLELNHDDTWLVTFDVESLYTNIPQPQAILRIHTTTQQHNTQLTPNIYKALATYVLSNNYFTFNNKTYKQNHGTAMGNPSGGSIANTYLITWETQFLNNNTYKENIKFYARYHDDGFIIWHGPLIHLLHFFRYVNTLDTSIKITHQQGKNAVYLDLELKLTTHNSILTRTHRKPTASETYLNFNSSHPHHLKRNLPFSIALRSFLLCNQHSSYHFEKTQIIERFRNSNYSHNTIIHSISKMEAKYKIPQQPDQYAYNQARTQALNAITQPHPHETTDTNNTIYLPLPYHELINRDNWANSLSHTHT